MTDQIGFPGFAGGLKTVRAEEQASGVVRDTDENKVNYDLIYDGPMVLRWAAHLTLGVSARGKRNWMKANSPEDQERFRESASRHFNQWRDGKLDEDHAAALFFNVNGHEYVRGLLIH